MRLVLSYACPALVFLLVPFSVERACRRYSWLGKIGPIMVLYILGALLGNLPLIGVRFFGDTLPSVQQILSSITIPLAIPLLLFGCSFSAGNRSKDILAAIFGLLSSIVAVVLAYLLLGKQLNLESPALGPMIGALATGSYTGGTVNMASIQRMLSIPEEYFILANTADMIVSFLNFVFLMTVGVSLLRKFLGYHPEEIIRQGATGIQQPQDDLPYTTKRNVASGTLSLSLAAGIFLVSLLVSRWADSLVKEDIFMIVLILLLTTLGILLSFNGKVRGLPYNSPIGMYLIYVFSMVVASMADLSRIDLAGSLSILAFMGLTVIFSLLIFTLLSRISRIDADTMIITSISYINSPPFVPMMASFMKNPSLLVKGISTGLLGYALGNYLGILLFKLLSLL